ncbi:MAG TPA: NADPH-dependent FMN reductase [Ktedonobacterales bacterium]|nr:NADPH-dependent FMN reductase [Ktedonobacterales bacterium]
MSDARFHILGLTGSLRRGSFNTGLLRVAQELAPDGVEIEIADISAIPLYNEDLNREGGPAPVQALKQRAREADALLFATPEYNYSMTGVQKNLIDWLSRPLETTPLRHKPVAMMGAGGMFGTVRSQLALRQVFLFTESYAMINPQLMIMRSSEYFDAEGRLLDEALRQRVRMIVEGLVAWTQQISPREGREA